MTFSLGEAKALLHRTPAALGSLLTGLPEAWLSCDEGSGSWTPRDVLAHLADVEDTEWVGRAIHLLEHGEAKPFAPLDRHRFVARLEGRTVSELLATFGERRRRNLVELDGLQLTPERLRQRGRHPAFGSVTLEQLLATWAVHDLTHVAQIVRVMARRYDRAVGPWREYLPILTRYRGAAAG